MRRNARWVVLLAGAGAVLGTAMAQNNNAAAQARAAAASPAPNFASSPREKLVVAMPKTYARAETMLLWGDYFNHLARCGNLDLQNQHGESLERSSNIDLLGEKELIDGIASGKVQLAQVNPGLVPQPLRPHHMRQLIPLPRPPARPGASRAPPRTSRGGACTARCGSSAPRGAPRAP